MISTKKHIQQLVSLLNEKGVNDIVISPGSRNGPITHTLVGCGLFNCRNIVDERSAAYFALGLSQALQKPVALVCSSGTASLNYAPAIAEAFYLQVPLVALTADRPDYWIDQAESQCIRQENIYQNFTRKSISLPLGESDNELRHAAREINECLNVAIQGTPAPVHINVPLEEPLHDLEGQSLPSVKAIELPIMNPKLTDQTLKKLANSFDQAKKILILAGQQTPNPGLENQLSELAKKTGAVVLKEHLANLNDPAFCSSIDLLMTGLLNENPTDFQPDLLFSFGGQFVSKSLKQFLRNNKPQEHWHLSLNTDHFDTYQSLTQVLPLDASDFIEQLTPAVSEKSNSYQLRWQEKEKQVNQIRDQFINQTDYTDLKVFDQIRQFIPPNSYVHLGNSSPVRYALICQQATDAFFFGNRGTSGIDGSLSTAVGFASTTNQLNTVILGDLSFFYDSNALWNKYISNNLRIIVVNNRGGNIFGLIKGPDHSPAFKEHFLTEHSFEAKGIAQAFGLNYLRAENEIEVTQALTELYAPNQQQAVLLEIFTDSEKNSQTFRALFQAVKQ